MSVGSVIHLDAEDEDKASRLITSVGLTWRLGDMVDQLVTVDLEQVQVPTVFHPHRGGSANTLGLLLTE
jgi:hypothetical protein